MTKNIIFTIVILLVSFFFFEFSRVDIAVQDYFYLFHDKHWVLDRNEATAKLIFYDGIKIVFILFVLSTLLALIFFRHTFIVKKYKRGLVIVFLSCISVPLLVGSLKATTNVPCPKNIERYGGDYPYVTVLSEYPETFQQQENIKCYPAGHASGGFALMSLFFLFTLRKNRQIALATAATIGWSIGAYKMLIGDHFLSHTFISMVLAWLIILLIVQGVNKREWQDVRK